MVGRLSHVFGCAVLLLAQHAAVYCYHVIFSGNISGECAPGQAFVISGISHTDNYWFQIGLRHGAWNYVFLLIFETNQIQRFVYKDGSYLHKEISENLVGATQAYNPIRVGEPFKIYIFVGSDDFWLAINDKPYASYKQRLTLTMSEIMVTSSDDSRVSIFQFDHRTLYPMPCPTVLHNVDPELVDFSHDSARRFRSGHRIEIVGVPLAPHNGGQFVLQLFEDAGRPVLHFNPHFGPDGYVEISALNARGVRLDVKRYDGRNNSLVLPFARNSEFRLTLTILEDKFLFAVKGVRAAQYQYQMACAVLFGKMNGLRVRGKDGMTVKITAVNHYPA